MKIGKWMKMTEIDDDYPIINYNVVSAKDKDGKLVFVERPYAKKRDADKKFDKVYVNFKEGCVTNVDFYIDEDDFER